MNFLKMVHVSQQEPNCIRGDLLSLVLLPSRAGGNVCAGPDRICREEKRRRAVVKAGMGKCEETASFRPLK